jgi:hypothetical protein
MTMFALLRLRRGSEKKGGPTRDVLVVGITTMCDAYVSSDQTAEAL